MFGKPHVRLNNLKTSLRFPCHALNSIIDSVNPICVVSLYSITAIELNDDVSKLLIRENKHKMVMDGTMGMVKTGIKIMPADSRESRYRSSLIRILFY